MSTRTVYPPFSWSFTRHRTFQACRLRYYYQYYLSQGGWHSAAPAAHRRAYALKHLTTLEAVLGTAVHGCARRISAVLRRGRPAPPEADLVREVRGALNGVWQLRDRETFRKSPRQHPMLREVYYGSLPDDAAVERVRDSLRMCVRHLVRSPVWEEIARCRPADVRAGESFLRFRLEDTDVIAVPDLAYRSDSGVTVLDWKTGAGGGTDLQLAAYALGLAGAEAAPGQLHGRVVFLRPGTERTLSLGAAQLETAAERILESAAEMRALLADPRRNLPQDPTAFPPTDHRPGACGRCNFHEICPFRPLSAAGGESDRATP